MKFLTGFSLVEIVIGLVIISIAVVGLASVFVSGRRFTVRSILNTQAANTSQRFLDLLKQEVGEDTWTLPSSPLNPGTYWTTFTVPINATTTWTYRIDWTVDTIGGSEARRVTANITWSLPP